VALLLVKVAPLVLLQTPLTLHGVLNYDLQMLTRR